MKPEIPHKPAWPSQRLRHQIASEAARIMVEDGLQDYRMAKEKALRHLALSGHDGEMLPSNAEVMAEVELRLRLFQRDSHPTQLRRLRELALQVMHLLQPFEPRLVGAVLEGAVTAHTEIQLHLFADTPESLFFFMLDQDIPYQEGVQSLRFGQGHRQLPVIRFVYSEVPVHCAIFSLDERETPISAVTGKAMHRARAKQLEVLLEENA